MFVITWNEGDIRGYKDLLDEDLFVSETHIDEVEHLIIEPKTRKMMRARFALSVKGNEAILDYSGRHKRFNGENLVDIGQFKIVFSDETFREILTCFWKPEGQEFEVANVSIQDSDITEHETEGNPVLAAHYRRERKPFLVRAKIESVLKSGRRLECEACNFSFADKYGELGNGYCEVHHRTALREGMRITSLADLAIVCSNCHRMIHRASDPMPSVEDFASQYIRKPT